MNSAPHLHSEDRKDFEAILDDVLRAPDTWHDPAAGGDPLNTEQLRTMALGAAEPIRACADPEYQSYAKLREQWRAAGRRADGEPDRDWLPDEDDGHTAGLGHPAVDTPSDGSVTGPGLAAVVAVLTPILAGTAAVIFLLLGYALGAMAPEPAIAAPLRTTGWFFATVMACGAVLGMAGLLVTALRNGATAIHDGPDGLPPEVAAARDAWHSALRERGILPFLQEALAKAALATHDAYETPPTAAYDASSHGPRMPRLGYSRPDFSSPSREEYPLPGHSFSSPDFSSPDFGGPDSDPR